MSTTLKDSYQFVTVERLGDTNNSNTVGLITLNRPAALNALCDDLFTDLIHAATALDQEDGIGCMVLTGSTKAFAAGADITEMKDRTFDYAYQKVRRPSVRDQKKRPMHNSRVRVRFSYTMLYHHSFSLLLSTHIYGM
jgi:enoyl-CoA hydratase/carnithine racemase